MPVDFLHTSVWSDLEELLDSPFEVQQKLAMHIFNRLFDDRFVFAWELPAGDDLIAKRDLKFSLAQLMAKELLSAMGKKLKLQYPNGATRKNKALQLEQLLSYLNDIWIEDYVKHPKDPLAEKCQHMLPLLRSWPNADMRKRPEHGRAAQLWYLEIYREVSDNALKGFPRGPNTSWFRDQREKSLRDAFHEVPPVYGRRKMDVFHPETKELFVDVTEEDIKRWSKLPKHKVALEITSKILARTGVQITANTLHRMLPELRKFDRQLETVKNTLQKSK